MKSKIICFYVMSKKFRKITRSCWIFIFLIIGYLGSAKENPSKKIVQTGKTFDVFINIYERHVEITTEDIEHAVFSYGYETESIKVDVYVRYFEDLNTKDSLVLDVHAPFIKTTLEPVKIPPKNGSSKTLNINYKNTNSESLYTSLSLTQVCQWKTTDEFPEYICEEFYPGLGNQKISLILKNIRSQGIIAEKEIEYKVYDPDKDIDLSNQIHKIERLSNSKVLINGYELNNFGYKNLSSELKLYSSENVELDDGDRLLDSLNIGSMYGHSGKEFSFLMGLEVLESLKGKYLLTVSDGDERINEVFEKNNISSIKIAPDPQITDIRMYQRPDNWVAISATVINKGNTTLLPSKLDFYVENYPRRFVARGSIPSLKPGETYTVSTLVSRQYYSIRLYLRDLILILDPDNDIDELDETNNEKRFKVPRLNGEQTFVKVSPNPLKSNDYEINFDFPVNRVNAEVKLSIYDHRGILQYQTNALFPDKGNQRITVPSHRFIAPGMYHYSFLIGWGDHYFPFTGTIIKE